MRHPNEDGAENISLINISIKYDNEKTFMAELFGNKINWGTGVTSRSDLLWELFINKKIIHHNKNVFTLFLSVHNILNASQYFRSDYENPRRWVEVGIKYEF